MRIFYTLLMIELLLPLTVSAQYQKTVYKLIELKKTSRFYVNSITNIGGKPRITVPIDLPPNTVQWYFSFTTHTNQQDDRVIDLAGKLGGLLLVPGANELSTTTGELIANIIKPKGMGVIDIYLTNLAGKNQFFEQDILGVWSYSKPNHYYDGTYENAKDGSALVDDILRGRVFLCLKNPHLTKGTLVTLDVSALVKEQVYVDEWTADSRSQLQEYCRSLFAHPSAAVHEVCQCCVQTLTTKHLPSTYLAFNKDEQQQLMIELQTSCSKETGHPDVHERQARIQQLSEEITGLEQLKDYKALLNRFRELEQLGVQTPDVYNSLGWFALLNQRWDLAKTYLGKGLGKDPTNLYLQGNLAHYFLLTGQRQEAEAIYWKYRRKRLAKKLTWRTMVKTDFALFEQLGISNDDMIIIKKKLRIR